MLCLILFVTGVPPLERQLLDSRGRGVPPISASDQHVRAVAAALNPYTRMTGRSRPVATLRRDEDNADRGRCCRRVSGRAAHRGRGDATAAGPRSTSSRSRASRSADGISWADASPGHRRVRKTVGAHLLGLRPSAALRRLDDPVREAGLRRETDRGLCSRDRSGALRHVRSQAARPLVRPSGDRGRRHEGDRRVPDGDWNEWIPRAGGYDGLDFPRRITWGVDSRGLRWLRLATDLEVEFRS